MRMKNTTGPIVPNGYKLQGEASIIAGSYIWPTAPKGLAPPRPRLKDRFEITGLVNPGLPRYRRWRLHF